jgi:hypothetical protein
VHLGYARAGETLRDKLLAHLEHDRRSEQRPTHYSWEISAEPVRRAWQIALDLAGEAKRAQR